MSVSHVRSIDVVRALRAQGLASERSSYRLASRCDAVRVGPRMVVMPIESVRRELGDLVADGALACAAARVGR
jgi:hypothetical protein